MRKLICILFMKQLTNPLRTAIATCVAPVVRKLRGVSSDSFEVQYLKLLRRLMREGTRQGNRTGVDAISLHGAFVRFDVTQGFPALTTKKLAFKSVVGELVGFLRATTSAADFRALGCKVWDQNANENAAWLGNPSRIGTDDLGPVYGAQWRRWPAYKAIETGSTNAMARLNAARDLGYQTFSVVEEVTEDGKTTTTIMKKEVDQLRACLDTIISNPTDRRILFHGWNPAELDAIALPACHILYIFSVNVERREISLSLTMRSCDTGLGLPFNSASAAALLSLVGRLTGYTPKWVSITMADAHLYVNHVDMVQEQLRRIPMKAPTLQISDRVPEFAQTGKYEPEWLDKVSPHDFSLSGYQHHPALTAAMAV